jgi:hypothetical protein
MSISILDIRAALQAKRYETARRLCLAALADGASQPDLVLLLHEAYRRLGDYTAARKCLETLPPSPDDQTRSSSGSLAARASRPLAARASRSLAAQASRQPPSGDDQKLQAALLLAEDYALLANEGHYRSSAEAKAGLCVDEYLDKYRGLSAQRLDQAATLATTPAQQRALAETRRRCERKPHAANQPEPAAQSLPAEGSCRIEGRVRTPAEQPLANVKLVLGLEVPVIERDPATYAEPEMHYLPQIGEQRARETRTDAEGRFRFDELPAGRHEFIAACLDPLSDDIGTYFLAHDIAVAEQAPISLELTLDQWQSAEPLPVDDPFCELRTLDGLPCRRVHTEVMRNPFHYDFPRQLVSVELPSGVPADPGRLRLLCSDAPQTPMLFQLDGARLSFFAELPSLSDRVYALYLTEEGHFAASATAAILPEVEANGTSAVLSTGRADFRIAWGDHDDAAAPIQAVRGEDGLWRGQGRWALPEGTRIAKRESRILTQGPGATSVALTYHFDTGQTYEIQLTAQRDEPTLLVHEICPDLDAAFEFSLAEFVGGRGFLHWTPEAGSVHWTSLTAEHRELARLQESVAWWIPPEGFGYAMTADSLEQQDYIGVVSLRRGEWVDRAFERIAQGPGDDNRELDWPYPEMVGSTVSMITAHTSEQGDAYFRFKCFDGERRWALLVSTFSRNDGLWKEISAVQHKNSSPRLQEFKDWHLDETDRLPRPFVLTQRERLIHLREKERTPVFAPLRKRLANWRSIGNNYDQFGSRGLDAMLAADPLKLWALKKEIAGVAHIRSRMTLLGRDYSDMYSPVGGRPITPWAEVYDLIAATGVFTPDEERLTRASLMLMGHMYMQTDFMNWRFNSRNANFEADRVDIVGGVALAFHDNPDAPAMLDHCVSLMQRSLEIYCTPGSGKWYENPACYYLHASNCRLNLAFHLWNHGLFDATAIPRLKDYLSWALNLATAPYSNDNALLRDGTDTAGYAAATKVRRMPPIGDHAHLGQWFSEYFALMGKAYRQRDPEFADRLTWLYQAGGSHGGHFSRHALFYATMEADDLAPAPAPDLHSRRLEGFGSVFRNNVGTDEEFYLLFKLGPGGYRYHRTEGSIVLIANGQPLIFDGGEAGETWRHTTLSFGETHMPLAPGHVERFHSFDAVDFCQGVNPKALQPGEPVFLSDRCEHQLVELAHERYHEPHPTNSRSVLWVKDDYLILHDQLNLPADQLTHWHLQAVADDHDGDWRRGYRFKGRFGTDLQVLLPGQDFADERITQQPILEYRQKPADTFSMRHLQLSATAPDHVLAVLRPLTAGKQPLQSELLLTSGRLQGVAVSGAGIDDLHWFDRDRLEFEAEGIRFSGRYGSLLRRGDTTHLILQDGTRLSAAGLTLRSDGPAVSLTLRNGQISLQTHGPGTVDIAGLGLDQTLKVGHA